MALALDGHTTGTWASGTQFSVTGLTTTSSPDVIVAFIVSQASTAIHVTSLTTTGVTWQGAARKTTASTSTTYELWYGTAASTLSNQTTAVNLSGTPGVAGANAIVFGVSGANTAAINDSNASLPASNTGASGVAISTSGVSTSNANDMIIAGGTQAAAITETAGSGYTLINNISASESNFAQFQVFSATQSSISVSFGTNATASWRMIVDAIQAAPAKPPAGDITILVLDAHRINFQG